MMCIITYNFITSMTMPMSICKPSAGQTVRSARKMHATRRFQRRDPALNHPHARRRPGVWFKTLYQYITNSLDFIRQRCHTGSDL
jgi:hypothetical protein